MANICQDTFALNILIHVDCHLQIDEDDKEKDFAAVIGRRNPFTVRFTYVLGTDYDATHENFGFSSEYPADADPLGVLMNGVTISEESWDPADGPDISQSPKAMLSGMYSAVLAFPSGETAFNDLLALGRQGEARANPLFGGVLKYNQGV